MFFEKINSRKFIVRTDSSSLINKMIKKVNNKRNKLIEKGQILENEFDEMTVSYKEINKKNIEEMSKYMDSFLKQKMLTTNRKDFMIAEFNERMLNIKSWEVLGYIEPIEGANGEYTITSFNDKDLPTKYRELEDPSNCEHCNTNRKRNVTYVIRNKDTDEILQVGNSCMTDYISKEELSLLLSYTRATKEISETVKSNTQKIKRTLYGKNEILATMIAIKDANGNIDSATVFNTYDIEDLKNIHEEQRLVFEKYIPNDDHREQADDILDWYEELEVNNYSDAVFNVANLLNSCSDFLLEKEVRKIMYAIKIKDAIENKDDYYKTLMSQFNYGVEIGESGKFSYDYKDLYYASKMSIEEFGFVSPKENWDLNTTHYIMPIINPERLAFLDEENPLLKEDNIREKIDYLNKKWKKAKKDGEVNRYFNDLMDYAEIKSDLEGDFEKMIKQNIVESDKNSKNYEVDDFNRKIIWADKLFVEFGKNEEKLKEVKRTNDIGLTGKIFEVQGDSFEKWEVQFKSVEERRSEYYGTEWLEYIFEDRFGNKLSWSTNKGAFGEDDYTKEWVKENKDKWVEIKGKFKEYGVAYLNGSKEPVIKINYVGAVSNFNDDRKTLGEVVMQEKGKKFKVCDYKVESNEKIPYGEKGIHIINKIRLIDSEGDVKEMISENTALTHFEEGKFYRIGHMGNKKIRNFHAYHADEIDGFINKTEFLTKKQMQKYFNVPNSNTKIKIMVKS